MSEEESTSRRSRTNWHKQYISYWQKKLNLVKRHKVGAVVILIISTMTIMLPFVDPFKNVYKTIRNFFKSDKVVETTKVSRKIKSVVIDSTYGLFHQPFQYFMDTDRYAKNELVDNIELSNDDINVNVTQTDQNCGEKYIISNEKTTQGEIVHKLIPVIDFDNHSVLNWSVNDALNPASYDSTEYADINKKGPCDLEKDTSNKDIDKLIRHRNPGFEINIQNNTSADLLVNKVVLKVRKSAINTFPIIQVNITAGFDLPFYNEGFGEAKNLKMLFSIKKRYEKFTYDEKFKYQLALSNLKPTDNDEHFYNSDIKQTLDTFFVKEGVNLKRIERSNGDTKKVDWFKKSGVLGRFRDGEARVYGKLIYDGELADHSTYRDTMNFNYITTILVDGFGGAEEIETQGEHNIRLLPNGENYIKKFKVTQEIAPNSAKKLSLIFYSGKPSYHLFDLYLYYNNGKSIVIKNVFLNEVIHHSELDIYHSLYTPQYNYLTKIRHSLKKKHSWRPLRKYN